MSIHCLFWPFLWKASYKAVRAHERHIGVLSIGSLTIPAAPNILRDDFIIIIIVIANKWQRTDTMFEHLRCNSQNNAITEWVMRGPVLRTAAQIITLRAVRLRIVEFKNECSPCWRRGGAKYGNQCTGIHTARKYPMRIGSMQRFVIVSNRLLTIHHSMHKWIPAISTVARRHRHHCCGSALYKCLGRNCGMGPSESKSAKKREEVIFYHPVYHECSAFRSRCLKIHVQTTVQTLAYDTRQQSCGAHRHRLYYSLCLALLWVLTAHCSMLGGNRYGALVKTPERRRFMWRCDEGMQRITNKPLPHRSWFVKRKDDILDVYNN